MSGFAVGENRRCDFLFRVWCGQKGERTQTTYFSWYFGIVVGRRGFDCRCSRPRWSEIAVRETFGQLLTLRKIWVDGGYRGELLDWVRLNFKFVLTVVLRSEEQKGFVVLPRRWVVERTLAWLNHHRRLSKDYEVFPKTSETFILIAMTRLMLRRLQPLWLFKQSLSITQHKQ